MKIAVLPLDITYADKHANLISAAERLRFLQPDTDVVVLPETFTTGFVRNPEKLAEIAETNSGHTMDDVHRWASFFKVAVVGSFIARNDAGTRFYNRAFFVEPGGDETFYDKHHLFDLSGEQEAFTSGTEVSPVIRYMGWNFALGICYDLRFPEWVRNRGPVLYDALLLPANWPEERRLAWDVLLRARAIENQAYVAAANRSGSDRSGEYLPQSSAIIDFMGRPVGAMDANGIIHATLSRDELERFRSRLHSLAHQTPYSFLTKERY